MFKKLWNDDAGVVTIEYLVLGTFLGLALIVGVHSLAASLNSELSELAQSIGTFDQDYSAAGFTGCGAATPGSEALGDVATGVDITNNTPTGVNIDDPACSP